MLKKSPAGKRCLPYPAGIHGHAKAGRRGMNGSEMKLWQEFLAKFPHQFHFLKPIDVYIVDFFCPDLRIVVELDSRDNFFEDCRQFDCRRNRVIESFGFKIIRFNNRDITDNFSWVCAEIEKQRERLTDAWFLR